MFLRGASFPLPSRQILTIKCGEVVVMVFFGVLTACKAVSMLGSITPPPASDRRADA